MGVSSLLAPILRCRRCERDFVDEGERLRCACSHTVPVIRGIPRFSGDDYAESFGFEWSRFSATQIDGRRRGWTRDLYGHGVVSAEEESRRTFELKTGLGPAELAGKLVLDVGCGAGRFADVSSRHAAGVIGLDLTRAIDSASANLAGRTNVAFVQADLRRAPFRPATFDVIYSIGVLHHTPDTAESFRSLLRLLKPGGTIAIWVYERAAWRRPWLPPAQAFSDLYRLVTVRLPNPVLLRLCHARARLDDLVRTPRARRLLQKLLPGSTHPDLEWRTLDTFDWYSPRYQWKHTPEEVRAWFEDAGLADVRTLDVPVAVRGRLPPR